MSTALLQLSASILTLGGGGGTVTGAEVKWALIGFAAIMLASICWGAVEDLIEYYYGRDWPTVSAVIDVVKVTMVESTGISSTASHWWPYYVATLTYTYHNPEKRTGDYKRSFANEDDAKDWANSYQGETVKVHVDPRDPARSVLRKEEL